MPSRLLSCCTYLPQYISGSRASPCGALLVEVVGVHLLLAAVHLDHRRDEGDDVVADVLDERRLLDDQAVGQLHQHLGAAGLRRVHAAA